jgi:hypothetical protein
MERRLTPTQFEVRREVDGRRTLVGYAAVFDELSVPLPGWRGVFQEKLQRGAFRRVLNGDTRALWNHDPNYVLGRTTSGTLRLFEDERGLRVEITPPENVLAQAFLESIERGDVTQMSFAFAVGPDGQEWERGGEMDIRTITEVMELSDVSPVTYPAYPQTEVALRGYLGVDAVELVDGVDEESDGRAPDEIEREAGLRAQTEQRKRKIRLEELGG